MSNNNEHLVQMGIHSMSKEEYWMDECQERDATIAQLRQELAEAKQRYDEQFAVDLQKWRDASNERDAWQLDSMNAVYAAQQFDPLLYLQGDTGAADVMKRVLERLNQAQADARELRLTNKMLLMQLDAAQTTLKAAQYLAEPPA